MKILFLPGNIGSMQAITAQALNKHPDVSATCLFVSRHKYQTANTPVIFLQDEGSKINIFKWTFRRLKNIRTIQKMIKKADVLHYVWGHAVKGGLDLKWAFRQNKAIVIEWVGSDIRNPEVLSGINKYYKKVLNNGYEYKKTELSNYRNIIQKKFSDVKAIPVACAEMRLWIDKKMFPKTILLYQRINVKDFIPLYPDVKNQKPLLLHSPSAKYAKGSNIIIPIIEDLKKQYDFEFILLHDVTRETVLDLMQKADIFIDQIILGGYGMATMEAMSLGKPVMAYILPEVFEAGLSQECPIVNSNPDNFKEQLILLLESSQLRHEIGKRSRAFVEKFHDADKIALQLMDIYSKALEEKEKKNA